MPCKYYARSEVDRFEPYFSPLLSENLSHLPPALIITAEYDPLHDEGQKYAQRMGEAGNQVQVIDYSGMVHGFMSFPPFYREALSAFAKIAAHVGELNHSATYSLTQMTGSSLGCIYFMLKSKTDSVLTPH